MTAADVLAANGILRAPEVVELAGAAKLDLACAAVLLVKESGGGRNVWGHDGVDPLGAYDKGGPVTRDNYAAYRRIRDLPGRKGARAQGCGPAQLTSWDIQELADRIGGCWDWRANVRTGFGVLARHIARYGERRGFVAYNGGPGALAKPADHPAQRYGDDAVTRLARWRTLLANTTEDDDMPLSKDDLAAIADAVWAKAIRNAFGDTVRADQILTGTEQRVADVQDKVKESGQ